MYRIYYESIQSISSATSLNKEEQHKSIIQLNFDIEVVESLHGWKNLVILNLSLVNILGFA